MRPDNPSAADILESYRAGTINAQVAAGHLYCLGWKTDEIGAEIAQIDDETGRFPLGPNYEIPGET